MLTGGNFHVRRKVEVTTTKPGKWGQCYMVELNTQALGLKLPCFVMEKIPPLLVVVSTNSIG